MLSFGFKSSWCSLIFVYSSATHRLYILVYVDDIIVTGSSPRLVQDLITKLNYVFALNQLGNLDYFLGIAVKQLPNGSLLLTQGKYITDFLA